MDANQETSLLPETVETLLDWKLVNSDAKFNEDDFLNGYEDHAKAANSLFDEAFAVSK